MAKRKASTICIDLTGDDPPEASAEKQHDDVHLLLPRPIVLYRHHQLPRSAARWEEAGGDYEDIFRNDELSGADELPVTSSERQDDTLYRDDCSDAGLSDFSEISDDDGEEVQVIEPSDAIQNSVVAVSDSKAQNDEEVQLVATKNQVRLPHLRQDCPDCRFLVKKPGVSRQEMKTANILYCGLCYCYVCDIPVRDCSEWTEHCHANAKSDYWKGLRLSVRQQHQEKDTSKEPCKDWNHPLLPSARQQPPSIQEARQRPTQHEQQHVLAWLTSPSSSEPDTTTATCPRCGMYCSSCRCQNQQVVWQHCIHCRGMQGDCACLFGCQVLLNTKCTAVNKQCPYCNARQNTCSCPLFVNYQTEQQTTLSNKDCLTQSLARNAEIHKEQSFCEAAPVISPMDSLAACASLMKDGMISSNDAHS